MEEIIKLFKSEDLEDYKIGLVVLKSRYSPEEIYQAFKVPVGISSQKNLPPPMWYRISNDLILDRVVGEVKAYHILYDSEDYFWLINREDEELKL